MKKIRKLIFGLLITPGLVWMILHPQMLFSEWLRIPGYFKTNITTIFSQDKLAKINEARWNAFGPEKEDLPSGIFYNKAYVLADNFFSLLAYFSPRYYFQSGDGTGFTPKGIEPIAAPAIVFWFLGIAHLLKKKRPRLIYFALVMGIAAYVFGQKNFAFLFPVMASYTGIVIKGIGSLKGNVKTGAYIFLSAYGAFLLGRMFFLNV